MRYAVMLFAIASLAATEPDKSERSPVPDSAALTKAEKTIKDIFKAEYAKKKTADQVDLAGKLLKQAEETNDDPAARFVLLREARDIAAKASDAALASRAVDEMATRYDVPLLKAKLEMLELLDKSATTVAAANPVLEIAMSAAEGAVDANDYDSAGKFLKLAASAAAKVKVAASINAVSLRTKEIDRIKSEYEKIKPDLETLKIKTNDADAAERAGRFFCLLKGDWTVGLPLLAKCKDEKLAALAKQDSGNPETAKAKVELADAWHDFAQTLDKDIQSETMLRAAHWYKDALSDLTGLTKTRVEKRVAELDKLFASRDPLAAVSAGWTVLFRSQDPSIWNSDVKRSVNHQAMKLDKAPEKTRYLKMTDCVRNSYVIVEITKDNLSKCVDTNGYGWNGTNKFEWKAYQLGIYDPAWNKFGRGDICIRTMPNLSGWGFGIRHGIDDKTGYCWAGKVAAVTTYEIAVKTSDLTAEEKKYLLSKKK